MITYYHTPNCSKSNHGLQLINAAKPNSSRAIVIRDIIKSPLSLSELSHIVTYLSDDLMTLVRHPNVRFGNQKNTLNNTIIINYFRYNPLQLQRPIIATPYESVVCRPLDRLNRYLM